MRVLHVGVHKTGTTSIQAALRMVSHRSALGLLLPRDGVRVLSDEWVTLLTASASCLDLVVSDETLLGDPLDGYSQAEERVDALRRLRPVLGDVQVIVYFRPQASWLPSVYTQSVQGGSAAPPEEFMATLWDAQGLRWMHLLRLLTQAFGTDRVTVRLFDPRIDAVGDFFDICRLGGAPNTGGARVEENVSVSAAQVPILRELNSDPALSKQERAAVRAFFQIDVGISAGPRMSPFSEELQQRIAEAFAEDWRELLDFVSSSVRPGATRRSLVQWPEDPLPFAGSGLEDPAVKNEVVRSLRVATAMSDAGRRPSFVQRVRHKLATSPGDIPNAARRGLRRQP